MNPKFFAKQADFRSWLEKNHDKELDNDGKTTSAAGKQARKIN